MKVKRILLPLIAAIGAVSYVTAEFQRTLTLDEAIEKNPIKVHKVGKKFQKIGSKTDNTILSKKLSKPIVNSHSQVEERLDWLESKFTGLSFKIIQDYYNPSEFYVSTTLLNEDFNILYTRYFEKMKEWEKSYGKVEKLIAKLDNPASEGLTPNKVTFDSPINVENSSATAKVIEDNVTTQIAAIDKTKLQKEKSTEDDFVFFDYSQNKKENKNENSSPSKGEIDQTVANAARLDLKRELEREVNSSPRIAKANQGAKKASRPSTKYSPKDLPLSYDYSSEQESDSRGQVQKTAENNSQLQIIPFEYKFGEGKKSNLRDFEIRLGHSDEEILKDYNSGIVNLEKSLNSQIGITRGSILSSENMDIQFDIQLEKNKSSEIEIPVINRENFIDFLTARKFDGDGGYILVELDSLTDSVDIDSPYYEKIFLNSKFKAVKDDDDYLFVMFLGVEPGTTTINFIRNGREKYQKVALVEYGGIYFEPNVYISQPQRKVSLSEFYIFGKKPAPLALDKKEIGEFTSHNSITKSGVNNYSINSEYSPYGSKRYIRLQHMGVPFWIGQWSKTNIEVPSEQYMAYMMNNLSLNSLDGLCMVEFNFPKKVVNFNSIGRTGEDFLGGDRIFLNEEGIFDESPSLYSVKGLLLGDENSLINVQVQYEDGSEDLYSTVCAPGNYILEN